ncbi:MAG TPA: PfkB family carbohydrate kinase [Planctomycetota bacterium]|nr:PfkB family carbohydrate kinase [Planctomycetota bacterium]
MSGLCPKRFAALTDRFRGLRVAVVGDFCLDRYLDIDPALVETSLETGLPVRNVVAVRPQPGGAGTVTANLVALGVGEIHLIGVSGDDGEGFELRRALGALPGVRMEHFVCASDRATFTYGKPMLLEPGRPPRELERLDRKERRPTPAALAGRLAQSVRELTPLVDAMIVLEQVDTADTGTVTDPVLAALAEAARERPALPMLADSRVGLDRFPPLSFKLNAGELARHLRLAGTPSLDGVRAAALELARRHRRPAFVTLAERGIVAADHRGRCEHLPALPVTGPIDVVGAGDSVTANLCAALAAGADLREAITLANAAASIVIHQLGTTGTADIPGLRQRCVGGVGAASR